MIVSNIIAFRVSDVLKKVKRGARTLQTDRDESNCSPPTYIGTVSSYTQFIAVNLAVNLADDVSWVNRLTGFAPRLTFPSSQMRSGAARAFRDNYDDVARINLQT